MPESLENSVDFNNENASEGNGFETGNIQKYNKGDFITFESNSSNQKLLSD